MEDFSSSDAWAITKMVQLSTNSRKKRQQIDQSTKHRMLTQWDWWRTNYVDEASKRRTSIPLGPTRQLLDTIYQDVLVKSRGTADQKRVSSSQLQQALLRRYCSQNQRAHQLALTNAATSTRLMEASTPHIILDKEMARMTNGSVLSRTSANGRSQSLRSTVNSMSVLDFVPPKCKPDKLPPSPRPPPSNASATRRKQREIHMLYLGGRPHSPVEENNIEAVSPSRSTAMSIYTPDLESMSNKSFPMTLDSLKETHQVIEPKCISLFWRNPVLDDPDKLPNISANFN